MSLPPRTLDTAMRHLPTLSASIILVAFLWLGFIELDSYINELPPAVGHDHGIITHVGTARRHGKVTVFAGWKFTACGDTGPLCGFSENELLEIAAHAAEVRGK